MKVDREDLRRHFESLDSEELLAVERDQLTGMARQICDEELARRGLTPGSHCAPPEDAPSGDLPPEVDPVTGNLDVQSGPPPEWIENAACACAFYRSEPAENAATVLKAAGIPSHISLSPAEWPDDETAARDEYRVMVPGARNLEAISVLDRDLFNEQREEGWRTHFEALSDDELRAQNPDLLCAGLLDGVARLQRAYREEMARRGFERR